MDSLPRQVVTGAGALIVLAAVAGLYLGVSRSTSVAAGADETSPLIAPSAPVANAKPLAVQTPVMDEAAVRRLAREEAQAVLSSRAAPKKPVDVDEDDDQAETNSVTPDTPTVPLAPAKPATPAPTP